MARTRVLITVHYLPVCHRDHTVSWFVQRESWKTAPGFESILFHLSSWSSGNISGLSSTWFDASIVKTLDPRATARANTISATEK